LAGGFAVSGFVKNLPGGRVQVVAEGTPEELQSFLAAIHAEMGYYIGSTQQSTLPATGRFQGFDIRF
jgi:acylphosphatase